MHIITKAILLQRPREVIEWLLTQYGDEVTTRAIAAVTVARERQAVLLTRILSRENINLTLIALSDDDKFLLSIGVTAISRQSLHPLIVEMFGDDRKAFNELAQTYADEDVLEVATEGILVLSHLHDLLNRSARLEPEQIPEWQHTLSRLDFLLMDLAAIRFAEIPYIKLMGGLVGRD